MKKLTLIFLCLFSSTIWADCNSLAHIADTNSVQYGTKYIFYVKGQKGFRTYFHSAPSQQCLIKNLFIISKDSVIAYQTFKNEGQTWMYVMYVATDGNTTEGWVKEHDFKIGGSIDPVQP
ncbi:hypothetical protein [Acinetobacter sp. HY1485]|uniref:hypothetical protein n=1 Tax=Acinetobacter sp. HY1485 TaxID=2970918 RepID=UPI0022B981E9|nr:hypothetical protein [Acinetobacter sp. HY1485]